MARRFAQANDVDRDQPHWFHRDYWPLRFIRRGVLDFLAQHADALRGRRALDFGAGDSPYAQHFAARGIELLRADVGTPRPGVVQIDEQGRTPLPEGFVHAVVSTQVLEHVADVQTYLREAHRVLAPDGLLYLSTHGAFILHRHPTDFRRWTVDGLRLELEAAGFVVENMTPRLGMLACATHLRAIALGGLTRRVPGTGWLRPIIYGLANVRMAVEERLTPGSAMEAHPELLLTTARKRPS